MKKEYLNYSLEELIEDPDFISMVFRGKNHHEWESFLSDNPQFRSTVYKARKIVEILRDRHEPMNEDDILAIWKNIDDFDDQVRNHTRHIKLLRFTKYAAILVVAMFVGAAGYWFIHQYDDPYVFSTTDKVHDNEARLFLSDGTKVDLEKENSKINMNNDQQIIIDNDQVIDMHQATKDDATKMNEVVIPYGKRSQLALEDGTKVWLNAGSKMAFPTKFTGKNRVVFLEGEAYFEVAHNEKVPFLVNTNDVTVKVLGTRFNLSAYRSDQHTETVLIEGKVAISERSTLGFLKNETIIKPNQKATYTKADKKISVTKETDVELDIAWTEGWLKFSHQSLIEVLTKLQRFYNIQFIYDRDFATLDIITGKLDLKGSVDDVMLALAGVANIQFRIDGSLIYVEKK